MRTNKVFILIGNRDTGKTDFTKVLVNSSQLPKKLIVDTFDNPVWRNMKTHDHLDWINTPIPIMDVEDLPFHKQGLYRIFEDDTDFMQDQIDKHCINSLVVVEDASRYFGSKLTRSQKKYLLNSKQKNCDIILVFHYLTQVAPELLKIANYVTLFKTGEAFYDEKKYHFPEFRATFQEVYKSKNQYENITIKL